eukprot:9982924-Heterocapsa_arctica.AAC.1
MELLFIGPNVVSPSQTPIEYNADGSNGGGNNIISPSAFPAELLSALPHLAQAMCPVEAHCLSSS